MKYLKYFENKELCEYLPDPNNILKKYELLSWDDKYTNEFKSIIINEINKRNSMPLNHPVECNFHGLDDKRLANKCINVDIKLKGAVDLFSIRKTYSFYPMEDEYFLMCNKHEKKWFLVDGWDGLKYTANKIVDKI